MRKFLRIFAKLCLVLFSLTLLFVYALLIEPGWFIDAKTFNLAKDFFKIPLTYDKSAIRAESLSFAKKHFDFRFSNLCFESKNSAISTCANNVEIAFTIQLKLFGLRVTGAGPININGEFFRGDFSNPSPKSQTSSFHFRNLLPENLRDFKLGDVYVVTKKINIKTSSEDLDGDMAFSKIHSVIDGTFRLKSSDLEAHFALANRAKNDIVHFNGTISQGPQLAAKVLGSFDPLSSHGEGDVDLKFDPTLSQSRSHLDVFLSGESVIYDLSSQATLANKMQFDISLKGSASSDATAGTLRGDIFKVTNHIRLGDAESCRYKLEFKTASDFECRFEYFVPASPAQTQIWPDRVALKLQAHVDGALPQSKESLLAGHLELALLPFKNPVLHYKGQIEAILKNYSFKSPLENFKIKEDIEISVDHFKNLISSLQKTKYQVPAPFNALDGSLSLKSSGELSGAKDEIPVVFASDLAGPNQILKTNLNLRIGAQDKIPFVRGEFLFDKVQLELPRFTLAKPPPLIPDSRIREKTALETNNEAQLKRPLKYTLVLKTGSTPLKLISNLTQGPIPIEFLFTLDSTLPPTGKVNVGVVPIELFRHKATIKFLNADFKSRRADENPVNGELVIPFADFTVQVEISGTEKKPTIKLQSEPPYSESQILAAVLFGKSPENLDADQASSVGNTQAAIADRALSLSSFYFLASTPVESVGYDSAGGMLTAKVKIKDGVSMDIGADSNQLREIGVNKRLGNAWYLHTYLTNPSDPTQSQSVTAFIEKLFRY